MEKYRKQNRKKFKKTDYNGRKVKVKVDKSVMRKEWTLQPKQMQTGRKDVK